MYFSRALVTALLTAGSALAVPAVEAVEPRADKLRISTDITPFLTTFPLSLRAAANNASTVPLGDSITEITCWRSLRKSF